MRKLLFVFSGLILLIFAVVVIKFVGSERIAENYIKSQGYEIIARKGKVGKYILDSSKLHSGTTSNWAYQIVWNVQKVKPENYYGKIITTYGFTVKNHPMQKWNVNAKDGVNVYIMMSESKVIGGYSTTIVLEEGGVYPLDGKR